MHVEGAGWSQKRLAARRRAQVMPQSTPDALSGQASAGPRNPPPSEYTVFLFEGGNLFLARDQTGLLVLHQGRLPLPETLLGLQRSDHHAACQIGLRWTAGCLKVWDPTHLLVQLSGSQDSRIGGTLSSVGSALAGRDAHPGCTRHLSS